MLPTCLLCRVPMFLDQSREAIELVLEKWQSIPMDQRYEIAHYLLPEVRTYSIFHSRIQSSIYILFIRVYKIICTSNLIWKYMSLFLNKPMRHVGTFVKGCLDFITIKQI